MTDQRSVDRLIDHLPTHVAELLTPTSCGRSIGVGALHSRVAIP